MADKTTKQIIMENKKDLESRERTYKELSKRGRRIGYFGILLFISSFVFVPLGYFIPQETAFRMWVLMFGIGFIIVFIGLLVIKSKGVPSTYFSLEEEIFLKVFSAITSLEAYMKGEFEPARHQSIKKLHEAHKLMKYYWEPSKISIVRKEIGNDMETLKERFEKNLISTVRNSTTKKNVQTILALLYGFGKFLISPDKEKLIELNEKMDSLPYSQEEKPSHRITSFLKRYQIPRHAVIASLIIAIGFLPAFIGVHYSDISMDTAYIVFITLFAPLITAYVIRILWKR